MTGYSLRYGGKKGKKYALRMSGDLMAVRTQARGTLRDAGVGAESMRMLGKFDPVFRVAGAGVEVYRCRTTRAHRDKTRAALKKEKSVRFAGRVLSSAKGLPVLYTENLFVKFDDDAGVRKCKKLIRDYGLEVKREIEYARNAWFLEAPEGTGLDVFVLAEELLAEDIVELCHPETVREMKLRGAFAPQWHLFETQVGGATIKQHAHVVEAWTLSQGEGVTIAVVDDGVDVDHEEFAGAGKVVAPRDATAGTTDPRPGSGDNHGTACAGVACANGTHGASGVAPKAKLMPIRLVSQLGSQAEADAFYWAAQNGADVISCSWGPWDGDWWDPNDPLHQHVEPLPDSTRLAIDYAITQGRGGKGCVVCWAAGNGNEPVENDGYASYDEVIAVAACNDKGKRAAYSDMGASLWCAFPSSHGYASVTPGIWTTDRTGNAGYTGTNYTDDFGGTSSSCPGAAGVAALILSRNPDLRWDEVRELMRQSCDRIDTAGGGYDATGHSDLYGHGRLNARKAVELAAPATPAYLAVHKAVQDVPIRDMKTSSLSVAVGDTKKLKDVKVRVEIEHTWISDLRVKLRPPSGTGVGAIVLHDRAGGSADNISRTYDAASTPGLVQLQQVNPKGTWKLEVSDNAGGDQGRILSFAVELSL